MRTPFRRCSVVGAEASALLAKYASITFVLALLVVGAVPSIPAATPEAPCAHPRIAIRGDVGPEGLVLGFDPVLGLPIPRPGSGIVLGRGTPEEPFLLQGLCLSGSADEEGPGLLVEGTTLHLVIEDVRLGEGAEGLWITNARNVTVLRAGPLEGVVLRGGADLAIRESVLSGGSPLYVEGVAGLEVVDNAFSGSYQGFTCYRSTDLRVEGNTLSGHGGGALRLEDCPGVVARNHVSAFFVGIEVRGTGPYAIVENNVTGPTYGIFSASPGAILRGNAVQGGSRGILLENARDNVVEDNVLVGGNLSIVAQSVEGWLHQMAGNSVDGRPFRYVRDLANVTFPAGDGEALIVRSTNITITGAWANTTHLRAVYTDGLSVVDASLQGGRVTLVHTGAEFLRAQLEGTLVEAHWNRGLVVRDTAFVGGGIRGYDGGPLTVDGSQFNRSHIMLYRVGGLDVGLTRFDQSLGSSWGSAIFIERVNGAHIHDNTFLDNAASLYTSASIGTRVERNDFAGSCWKHAVIFGSPQTRIAENSFDACGIELGMQAQSANVTRNDFTGHPGNVGIQMVRGALGNGGTRIDANNITGYDVAVSATAGTWVGNNNLGGNAAAGVATNGIVSGYDAKNNWWGCSTGPGTPGCDVTAGSVVASPWRTSPNPFAGRP